MKAGSLSRYLRDSSSLKKVIRSPDITSVEQVSTFQVKKLKEYFTTTL